MSNFVLETFRNLRFVDEKNLKISCDLKPMFENIYKDFPGGIPRKIEKPAIVLQNQQRSSSSNNAFLCARRQPKAL